MVESPQAQMRCFQLDVGQVYQLMHKTNGKMLEVENDNAIIRTNKMFQQDVGLFYKLLHITNGKC